VPRFWCKRSRIRGSSSLRRSSPPRATRRPFCFPAQTLQQNDLRLVNRFRSLFVLTVIVPLFAVVTPVRAVLFDATGDPTFNTTAPTGALASSGWELQGQWSIFLGTPIASNFFITAAHFGGTPGELFN